MKELNLGIYQPEKLIKLILILSVVFEIIRLLILQHPFDIKELLWPLGFTTFIFLFFKYLHQYGMWSWLLKLLNLTDVRGHYTGELVSSFHVDDDPSKDHIKMIIDLIISQNLNGIFIRGTVTPTYSFEGKTSAFQSISSNLTKLEDGNFLLEYSYTNTSNTSHSWHKKYVLTSHIGWTHLLYNLNEKKLTGFYGTYQNASGGTIGLTLQQ